MEMREAVLEAGATRLRPILMTAIATIGALTCNWLRRWRFNLQRPCYYGNRRFNKFYVTNTNYCTDRLRSII